MKLHQLVFVFGLLLVILLSTGCGKQGNSDATTSTTTALANSTKTYTATRTVISPTLTKPSTPIPIATQPYIPTPGFTATSSSIPTLAVEDARAMLNDLLVNNGYCHLPCLWGISPGATTSQEAKMILSPMGGLTNFNVLKPDIGNISLNDPMKNDLLLSIFVTYLADQGTVFSTSFQARALKTLKDENGYEDIYDSTSFGERLDFYSLHQVLTNQGRPSSVLLSTLSEFPTRRGMPALFSLILLYPEQGIIVKYTTEMRVVGTNVEGCMQNAHIEMDLFPPGDGDAFNQALTPTDWPVYLAYHKPIEEVTSLSIDDFYETFRQPTDKCLVTPARLWPTPEK